MTEIKICGITKREDALAACESGVNALGFIFHPASPRCVTPEQARAIIASLPPGVATVGVFVNEDAARVKETVVSCGIDWIQLHGDESPAYCRAFLPERIIKAVSPETDEGLAALGAYAVRAFLVDARTAERYGGTGTKADWRLAARLAETVPIILAGGLHEGNIAEALEAVRPRAVDINSGVELSPGIKDHERMRRIIALIRKSGTASSAQPAIFGKGGAATDDRVNQL